MDPLTHITLGAAVGETVLGPKVGARAALWGAVYATLPDFDIFIPMGDAVANFTGHRSFSHSLFVLAALTPILTWLILKIHPQTRDQRHRWLVMVYVVLATHVLLDCLTVYGTQIFWPFTDYPVAIGSVFIVDPAYTVPLLLGVTAALIWRRRPLGRRLNLAGIALSSAYLAWGFGAQLYVQQIARHSLAAQGIGYQHLLAQPTPFNSVLWRIVAMGGDHYRVGYHSLFDPTDRITTRRYESSPQLLEGLKDHWPVRRLQQFTHGFYAVDAVDGAVVISDLRMGIEPDYVFRFQVGEVGNPHPKPVTSTLLPVHQDLSRLPQLWRRIWHADAAL